jgi:hypothetical protein
MAPKPKSEAFDVTDAQLRKSAFKDRAGLCSWLCTELENAISARSGVESEIKYAWAIYQQDRTRGRNTPWPDAADLTSPYGAEYVDALHARLMANTFTDTVWMVEGWGESAEKAPFVEEFHQRAQEDERYQGYEDERVLRALIEGVGTLEITESVEMRRQQDRKRVKLRLHEGAPVLGEDNEPELEQDELGAYVEAQGEDPSAEVDVDSLEPVRIGPSYDVIPFLDFLTLPQHAKSKNEVWGYAKRFWRRVPELTAKVMLGMYDKQAVKDIGEDNERQTLSDEAPTITTVPTQDGPLAQKELWEVQFLADCDGKGERWYRATVSKDRVKLLRLKVDDRTTRYNQFIPFPKPGSAGRGYSLITNKMITVIEEDTAIRNLRADRAAFKASQPILRKVNALWDPYEQPMGPGRVLDVRDANEITLLQGIEDVSNGVMLWKQDVRTDGDRLLGTNDTALGQNTDETKTLGEVQLRAGYSEVRINVILKRHAESVEEVGMARHTIWKRTLRERENLPPMRATRIGRMADGIEVSGLGADGTVSADLLEGIYWFKPKGSVETSDLMRVRSDFVGFLQALGPLMQMNPQLGMLLRTVPAAKSIMKQAMRVFRWPDRQSILGPEGHGVFEQMEQQTQMQNALADPRMQLLQSLMGASDGAQAPGAAPMGGQAAPPAGGPPQASGPVM